MANITESPDWEPNIYEIATTDRVLGGPSGIANRQAQQLANRTKNLDSRLVSLTNDVDTLSDQVNGDLSDITTKVTLNATHYGTLLTNNEGAAATNKATIQAAIDAASAAGYGTVVIPPGLYFVATNLNLKPGITILGYGATLKRPASQTKFARILTSDNTTWNNAEDSPVITIKGLTLDGNRVNQGAYLGYELEHQALIFIMANAASRGRLCVHIEDVYFKETCGDGLGVYNNVNVKVINCKARNCFRGGMTMTGGWTSALVQNWTSSGDVHNSFFQSEVTGDNGWNGTGRGATLEVLVNGMVLEDGGLDVGFKEAPGGTILINNLVHKGPSMNLDGRYGVLKFTNCDFTNGNMDDNRRLIYPHDVTFENCNFRQDQNPDDVTDAFACIYVAWQISAAVHRDQRLAFKNCRFYSGKAVTTTATVTTGSANLTNVANIKNIRRGQRVYGTGIPENTFVKIVGAANNTDTIVLSEVATASDTGVAVTFDNITGASYGIYTVATPQFRNCELIVDGCEFIGPFDAAMVTDQGGTWRVSNTVVNGAAVAYKPYGSSSYPMRAYFNNARAFDCTHWMFIGATLAGNYLEFQNMLQSEVAEKAPLYAAGTYAIGDIVKDANGVFYISRTAANTAPLTDSTKWGVQSVESTMFTMTSGILTRKRGSRVILTTVDPTTVSTQGLIGDVRRLDVIPTSGCYEWLCVVESNTAATWVPVGYVHANPQPVTTAGPTVLTQVRGTVYVNRATLGTVAITLPAPNKYMELEFICTKGDESTNPITLTAPSGQINGASTFVLDADRMTIKVKSDGTNYFVVS